MKSKPIRSPKFCLKLREYPCMIKNCEGENCNLEAAGHHLSFVEKRGGMATKTCDSKQVPLCRLHHSSLHNTGEKTFWAKYGYSLEEVEQYADNLWFNFNERY